MWNWGDQVPFRNDQQQIQVRQLVIEESFFEKSHILFNMENSLQLTDVAFHGCHFTYSFLVETDNS